MSEKFDRAGLFRGVAVDGTLGQTTNGFPQVVLKVVATELYDEAEAEWKEWDYEMGCTGYLCLMGQKDGDAITTFSYDNVKDVFEWDGASFATLQNILAAIGQGDGYPLQFRMVEDDYEQAKFDYKLQGVYLFDAPPTRELRQLDADAVKDLDKMFGAVLAGKKKPTAAKSNKAGGKKTPPTKPVAGKKLRPGASTKDKVQANADVDAHVAADAEERDAREQAKVAKRQAAKDKREASAAAKKAGKKTGPPAVSGKKSPAEDEDVAACTHTEAWDAMVEARENAGLGEGVAEEAYRNSVFAVVGDLKSDDQLEAVTDAQWAEVRDIALTEINDLLDSPAN